MKSLLRLSLLYIQGYCTKHMKCDTCAFDKLELCPFSDPPVDWDVDKMLRKEEKDAD